MKTYLKYLAVLLVVLVPVVSFAAEFRGGDQPSVRQDEKITNDVYMGGQSVTSAGAITGDLIAGGATIIVTGDVSGDVALGGGNINLLSNVGDDVRVGGGTVVIQGKIGGDLVAGGGTVTLGGAGVLGDATIGAGTVHIDAPITGNALIGGGEVYINAPITGNVKIDADKVTLGSGAVITGTLTYKSKTELTKEPGATVNGEVTFTPRADKKEHAPKMALAAIFGALAIWKFFALLTSAFVIGMLLKRYALETVQLSVGRPWYELGRGLLVLVVTPVISIILMVTLVGIPFGILGFIAFFAMMMFAWIMAAIILGSVVYKYITKAEMFEVSWKTILLGVVLFTLVGFVPFIGWLANMLLVLIALGASTGLKLQVLKEWR